MNLIVYPNTNVSISGSFSYTGTLPAIGSVQGNLIKFAISVNPAYSIYIDLCKSGDTFLLSNQPILRKKYFEDLPENLYLQLNSVVNESNDYTIELSPVSDPDSLTISITLVEYKESTNVSYTNEVDLEFSTPDKLSAKTLPVNIYANTSPFDHIAGILGLERLPEDTNEDIKAKAYDAIKNPSSGTLMGFANSLARNLSLPKKTAITIAVIQDNLTKPFIHFDGYTLFLFSYFENSSNYIVDTIIDLETLEIKTIHDLVEKVNTYATSFSATSNSSTEHLSVRTLLPFTSKKAVLQKMSAQTRFILDHTNIDRNSVTFSNPIFSNEVESENHLQTVNDFYINYDTGLFACVSLPEEYDTVSYRYNLWSVKGESSEVIIKDLSNEQGKFLFTQKSVDSNNPFELKHNALLTNKGAEVIKKLLDNSNIWGE